MTYTARCCCQACEIEAEANRRQALRWLTLPESWVSVP
jgi:hypothetical protein